MRVLSKVVLPIPLCPSTPRYSSVRTVSEIPETIRMRPYPDSKFRTTSILSRLLAPQIDVTNKRVCEHARNAFFPNDPALVKYCHQRCDSSNELHVVLHYHDGGFAL